MKKKYRTVKIFFMHGKDPIFFPNENTVIEMRMPTKIAWFLLVWIWINSRKRTFWECVFNTIQMSLFYCSYASMVFPVLLTLFYLCKNCTYFFFLKFRENYLSPFIVILLQNVNVSQHRSYFRHFITSFKQWRSF